jgi:hypothetical protein
MDTLPAIVALLKELGTPAITVIGFAWVLFKLNASKKDMSALDARLSTSIAALDARSSTSIAALDAKLSTSIAELRTELKADIAGLRTELKADIAGLETTVSALAVDVRSIKNNHLPHIEAAINELAKGTPNEAHVTAILDLSHKADLG